MQALAEITGDRVMPALAEIAGDGRLPALTDVPADGGMPALAEITASLMVLLAKFMNLFVTVEEVQVGSNGCKFTEYHGELTICGQELVDQLGQLTISGVRMLNMLIGSLGSTWA